MFTVWCDGKDGVDLEVLITVRGGPNPGFDGVFVRNFVGEVYLSSKQHTTDSSHDYSTASSTRMRFRTALQTCSMH